MVKVICNDTKIKIETSQGTLIAKPCDDPNYPGIWLEIDRPEFGNSMAVAKLEVYEDSGRVMLDVYSDALQDEVTEQIPIENLDRWEEMAAEDGEQMDIGWMKTDECQWMRCNDWDKIEYEMIQVLSINNPSKYYIYHKAVVLRRVCYSDIGFAVTIYGYTMSELRAASNYRTMAQCYLMCYILNGSNLIGEADSYDEATKIAEKWMEEH